MRWLLALLLAFYAPAAMAAWGTPTQRDTKVDSGAAHSLASNAVTIAQNSLILVTGQMTAAGNGNTILVTDSAGNSYTVIQHYRTAASNAAFLAYAIASTALSGGTVTVADTATGGTNFTHCGFAVNSVTGNATASVEDSAAQASNDGAATTSPTVTSGTPGTAGDLFVAVYESASPNTGTYTEDGNWTNINLKIGSANLMMSAAYLIDAGTSTHTHNPTTTNQNYSQVVTAFKLAVAASAARPGMLDLTGAGR
jgi:hypothetical protein